MAANTHARKPRRILVLYAHPLPDQSEVNGPLALIAANTDGVTLVDLYAEYPDLDIDVEREQQRLREHDVIVFLHPLYWYSTPAILKQWQDLVLERGFAYGDNATALRGKLFFSAISAGGPEDAYDSAGYNNFTLSELLSPLQQTANLCGMRWLPPFALFAARMATEDQRLKHHLSDWSALLEALRDRRLDLSAALALPRLNADLTQLIKGPAK